MKQLTTTGIVLSRTNYGEADRIVTMLTPDYGKLRLVARGVRKIKSKMAGGVELFSISEVSFIRGKGELSTLTSSRLIRHFERIVEDIERVQAGYGLIKDLNRVTEDALEPEYFDLLGQAFEVLDDSNTGLELIQPWFDCQLLKIAGYTPNLQTDVAGEKLSQDQKYSFDFDAMSLKASANGKLTVNHIKLLRLLFSSTSAKKIGQIKDINSLIAEATPIIKTLAQTYLRV